jgi:hypothetical protein
MGKVSVEVAYHVGVDREKVNRLVREYGSTLVAAVEAQRANHRPGQVYYWYGETILPCPDRQDARKQGVKTKGEFLVIGIPADRALGQYIEGTLKANPSRVWVGFDEDQEQF